MLYEVKTIKISDLIKEADKNILKAQKKLDEALKYRKELDSLSIYDTTIFLSLNNKKTK